MSTINTANTEAYRNNFLQEVEANVEAGDWVKMCTQCAMCSGCCPLGPYWEYSPHEIFMMIRAGKRDEVLNSDSLWMCTSCYNCTSYCPRRVPVTHLIHGLASYAHRLGIAPKNQPTRKFAKLFWDNLSKQGRVNELKLGVSLYFMNGFVKGLKTALKMMPLGRNLYKTKRLNPMEYFGGHGVEDTGGLHAILKKAREIEDAKLKKF